MSNIRWVSYGHQTCYGHDTLSAAPHVASYLAEHLDTSFALHTHNICTLHSLIRPCQPWHFFAQLRCLSYHPCFSTHVCVWKKMSKKKSQWISVENSEQSLMRRGNPRLVAEKLENCKNWRIRYKTRHLKVLLVHDLLPHHATAEKDNAAGIMTVWWWWSCPPPVLQIYSLHQVALGTPSRSCRRRIVIAILRGSGTFRLWPSTEVRVWSQFQIILRIHKVFRTNAPGEVAASRVTFSSCF